MFDTYKSSVLFDKFIKRTIPEGYIVIAACKDDCVTELSEEGKKWFEDMGSKLIRDLTYRCGFAFIGTSGSETCVEHVGMDTGEEVSVTSIKPLNGEIAIASKAQPAEGTDADENDADDAQTSEGEAGEGEGKGSADEASEPLEDCLVENAKILGLISEDTFEDTAFGCILGSLIGDAIGSHREFSAEAVSEEEMDKTMAMPGGGHWKKIGPGQITDDGELAMCLMWGLI